MKFKTCFDPSQDDAGIDCPQPGDPNRRSVTDAGAVTEQSHKEACDINNIVKRGVAHVNEQPPMYGDFSDPIDYQRSLHIVQQAEEQFMGLSAEVRERFGNDPRGFLEFATNGSNAEEMVKLGLMKPEAVERVKTQKEAQSAKAAQAKADDVATGGAANAKGSKA